MRSTMPSSSPPSSSLQATTPSAGGPTTTTGTPPALARTFGRNSGVVTTATAPESVMTWRSSSSLSRNSTGVATAPARQSAA